jgi:hypothetical protein
MIVCVSTNIYLNCRRIVNGGIPLKVLQVKGNGIFGCCGYDALENAMRAFSHRNVGQNEGNGKGLK